MKSTPDFIGHLSTVMLNNLKLARRYVPRKVDLDLLYFHATEITGDLDGILDRTPSAWRPFVGSRIEVHELDCHHEAVLNPMSATRIGGILQQRLSIQHDRWVPELSSTIIQQETEAIATAYV
jgi:enterobactin synthetase component F